MNTLILVALINVNFLLEFQGEENVRIMQKQFSPILVCYRTYRDISVRVPWFLRIRVTRYVIICIANVQPQPPVLAVSV